jgi:hypothetical protein
MGRKFTQFGYFRLFDDDSNEVTQQTKENYVGVSSPPQQQFVTELTPDPNFLMGQEIDPQLEMWERVVGKEAASAYYPNLLFKWERIKDGAEEKETPYTMAPYLQDENEYVVYSHYRLENQTAYPPDNVTVTTKEPWGHVGLQPEWLQIFQLSVPIFCMYAFVVPLGIYVVLIQLAKQSKLAEPEYRARYGWVYTRYNIRSWWWFAVIMLRKLSAIVIKRATPFVWSERTVENARVLAIVQSSMNLGIIVVMAGMYKAWS